jgi:hypothetical protein
MKPSSASRLSRERKRFLFNQLATIFQRIRYIPKRMPDYSAAQRFWGRRAQSRFRSGPADHSFGAEKR